MRAGGGECTIKAAFRRRHRAPQRAPTKQRVLTQEKCALLVHTGENVKLSTHHERRVQREHAGSKTRPNDVVVRESAHQVMPSLFLLSFLTRRNRQSSAALLPFPPPRLVNLSLHAAAAAVTKQLPPASPKRSLADHCAVFEVFHFLLLLGAVSLDGCHARFFASTCALRALRYSLC